MFVGHGSRFVVDGNRRRADPAPALPIHAADRSVERIVLLDKLELLLIQDAMITDAGIDRLREELPDCKIRR